jgi:hypothetical protein
MSVVLTLIGGGVAGALLTYGLSWWRERRRTLDSYRAPQREAIGGIIAATHELLLRETDFSQAMGDLANEAGGKSHRTYSDRELDDVTSQLNRAMLGVDRAFNVGRLTIVDAECFEAMGIAYNEFVKVKDAFSDFGTLQQTPANI